MADANNAAPRAIVLHARQDVNAKVDLDMRLCGITCAHPDGLLGVYEVIIPFHQIKRIAAAIIQREGAHELAEVRKQQAAATQNIRIVQ